MLGCTSTLTSSGLSPALRQLRDCRHTFVAATATTSTAVPTGTASRRASGVVPKLEECLTCKLAARVLKGIETEQRAAEVLRQQEEAARELVWARSCREILLMRHPTNWAGASLLQGPPPSEAQARELVNADHVDRDGARGAGRDGAKGKSGRSRIRDDTFAREGVSMGGVGDSRPKLVPGVMITLSALGAKAVMELTEEVHCEQYSGTRAQKALGIVHEATAEVAFANRRDSLRTGVLMIKLQAIARGWLARRRARVLLLRGGCRRELDQASGAWQYVWRYHSVVGAALGNNTRERDSESRLSCRAGGGGSGGGGKTFFRSWYPPALLKNEALPSPRAATRRVKTEGRKREARLAFANSLLDGQKERLRKRDARAERLLALAEVVKSVERATGCLEGAAVDCIGMKKASPGFSLRVLHPRGGQPGDGERDAVSAETLAAWRRAETKRREKEEAAAIRAAHDSRRHGKSPRSNSPAGGRGEGGRPEPSPTSGREPRGRQKREKKDSPGAVPTTNDNLAAFEQRALEASLHKNAFAAVASLLQRKRAVVAIRETARLGRNKAAWARSGTSPFCIGIQSLPSWLDASRRFIAFAHRGKLVAVSQASPFIYWENLVTLESRSQVLRGVLEPFLENSDLLKAMFAASVLPTRTTTLAEESTAVLSAENTNASNENTPFTTTAAAAATSTGSGGDSGEVRGRGKDGRGDGAWSQPLLVGAAANAAAGVAADPASGRSGASEEEEKKEEEPGGGCSWGYLSSLASRGCWKVDAAEIARRDDSVELGFDSIAFDVFVRSGGRMPESDWRRTATGDGESEAESSRQGKPTPSTAFSGRRAESSANCRDRDGDGGAESTPRAIVTTAVPFRLEHGLPRELGPLLFDADADADVLAGKADSFSSSSLETDALLSEMEALPGTDGSSSNLKEKKRKEDEEGDDDDGDYGLEEQGRGREKWTRKPHPLGAGDVLSHFVRGGGRLSDGDDGGAACVEVRLRAAPLNAAQLAKAGLPKDVSALVVGVSDDDAGNGKGTSGGGSGGGGGVGSSRGKTGTSRAC